jgi:hypothetical protein
MVMRTTIATLLRFFSLLFLLLLTFTACTRVFLSEDIGEPGLIYYLPKTLLTVTITAKGYVGRGEAVPNDPDTLYPNPDDDRVFSLEVGIEEKHVPDMRRSYVLSYQRNVLYTDQLCVGARDGLLAAVEVASADETGNIVVSLARLAGSLGLSPFGAKAVARIETMDHRKLVAQIDPLNPRHLDQLAERMRKHFGIPLRLSFPDAYQLAAEHFDDCPRDSVCYRTKVPLRYEFTRLDGGPLPGTGLVPGGAKAARIVTPSGTATVINQKVTGHIDVSRAFMVEKITRLEFDEGTLKSVAIRKPSEALGVAKLPLAVVDAIMTSMLAAPGKFLSNISGLPPQEQLTLIKQAQQNATEVANLKEKLDKLRQGDFLVEAGGRVAVSDDLFKIRCQGTFIPAATASTK